MRVRDVVLLVLLLLPSTAAGQGAVPEALDRLAAEMAEWVAGATDYAAPPPPKLAVVIQAVLKELCFRGCLDPDLPFVQGVYDPPVETIFLNIEFAPQEPLDRSYLLHEVVHHVQLFNGADETARCKAELEGEALRLQVRWLREEEAIADPLVFLGTDELTLRVLGSCSS